MTEMYADRPTIAHCLWCGQILVDGADLSGFTGPGPDYMTTDGDFGCDPSPDTNEDGCGSHTPDVVTTWDKHEVRILEYDLGDSSRRHHHSF